MFKAFLPFIFIRPVDLLIGDQLVSQHPIKTWLTLFVTALFAWGTSNAQVIILGEVETAYTGTNLVEGSIQSNVVARPDPGKPKVLVGGTDRRASDEIVFGASVNLYTGERVFNSSPFIAQALEDQNPGAVLARFFSTLLLPDGNILAAAPIRGTTGQFSQDVFALDLSSGFGETIPSVNFATQFNPLVIAIPSDDSDPHNTASFANLRAGPSTSSIFFRYYVPLNGFSEEDFRVNQTNDNVTGFDGEFFNFRLLAPKMQKGASQPSLLFVFDSFGSIGDDNILGSIQARFIGLDGAPIGDQWQVNTFTNGNQFQAKVATSPEGFVVVWTSSESPGDDNSFSSIQARVYGNDGLALGDQFQVNQATQGEQFQPAVGMTQDGGFIVAWTDIPITTSNVFARIYQPDGTPLGDQFQLNTLPGADSPAIAIDTNDTIIAWRRSNAIEVRTSFDNIFRGSFETP